MEVKKHFKERNSISASEHARDIRVGPKQRFLGDLNQFSSASHFLSVPQQKIDTSSSSSVGQFLLVPVMYFVLGESAQNYQSLCQKYGCLLLKCCY